MGLSIIYFLASPCQLYVSYTPLADRVSAGLDRSIGANASTTRSDKCRRNGKVLRMATLRNSRPLDAVIKVGDQSRSAQPALKLEPDYTICPCVIARICWQGRGSCEIGYRLFLHINDINRPNWGELLLI